MWTLNVQKPEIFLNCVAGVCLTVGHSVLTLAYMESQLPPVFTSHGTMTSTLLHSRLLAAVHVIACHKINSANCGKNIS